MTGFISTKGDGIAAQPAPALMAITLCVSVVPAVFMSAAALLMRGYTVDDELRRMAVDAPTG